MYCILRCDGSCGCVHYLSVMDQILGHSQRFSEKELKTGPEKELETRYNRSLRCPSWRQAAYRTGLRCSQRHPETGLEPDTSMKLLRQDLAAQTWAEMSLLYDRQRCVHSSQLGAGQGCCYLGKATELEYARWCHDLQKQDNALLPMFLPQFYSVTLFEIDPSFQNCP